MKEQANGFAIEKVQQTRTMIEYCRTNAPDSSEQNLLIIIVVVVLIIVAAFSGLFIVLTMRPGKAMMVRNDGDVEQPDNNDDDKSQPNQSPSRTRTVVISPRASRTAKRGKTKSPKKRTSKKHRTR